MHYENFSYTCRATAFKIEYGDFLISFQRQHIRPMGQTTMGPRLQLGSAARRDESEAFSAASPAMSTAELCSQQ